MKQIGIGLAGFGTVGAGVYKHLAQNRDLLSQRLGLEFVVQRIAVRDLKKSRSVDAPASIFTTHWHDVVDDPKVQVVVELMGGIEEALKEAQAAGYAEPDPSFDVNGWDAAHKAIILASLAYGFWVPADRIFVEGIEHLTANDIRFARKMGYQIKLLGIIKADERSEIEVRVHPTLIPEKHVLASVNGVFNAIAVKGDIVGDTLFYGRGAGQDPTSSAVISDIAEAADALLSPRRNLGFMPHGLYGTCAPIGEIVSEYYLRLTVEDRPGVIAQIAGILGDANIGISSILQPESEDEGSSVPLVMMLHRATNAQIQGALDQIASLACVKKPTRMIRVEHFT
jgi:homoserine dehydrogenase